MIIFGCNSKRVILTTAFLLENPVCRRHFISGHGRYEAYRKLLADAPNKKQMDRWSLIPCVVTLENSDYRDWGRRLSENKLRSFNWVAECISLARMRDHGKTAKELAALFGYEEKEMVRRVSLGNIPGLSKLSGEIISPVAILDAQHYLLPLRIVPQQERDAKGQMLTVDYDKIDYSECDLAIEKLVDGSLRPEDLPAYSAERRKIIDAAQQEARVKSLAAREVEAVKAQLTERDAELKKLRKETETEIAKAQKKAIEERICSYLPISLKNSDLDIPAVSRQFLTMKGGKFSYIGMTTGRFVPGLT